jgi:hypothetical protein
VDAGNSVAKVKFTPEDQLSREGLLIGIHYRQEMQEIMLNLF